MNSYIQKDFYNKKEQFLGSNSIETINNYKVYSKYNNKHDSCNAIR